MHYTATRTAHSNAQARTFRRPIEGAKGRCLVQLIQVLPGGEQRLEIELPPFFGRSLPGEHRRGERDHPELGEQRLEIERFGVVAKRRPSLLHKLEPTRSANKRAH